MRFHFLESTLLESAAYDGALQILFLQFRDHALYNYYEVPADVYDELLNAPSKGKYFNSRVRGRYRHQRVDQR